MAIGESNQPHTFTTHGYLWKAFIFNNLLIDIGLLLLMRKFPPFPPRIKNFVPNKPRQAGFLFFNA